MNICLICKSPKLAEADARLLAGATHTSVAKVLGVDRQVVGRHVRNGHVSRGNTAAGPAWTKPEPEDLDRATLARVEAATEAMVLALNSGDPEALAKAQAHPHYDWLLDRVEDYYRTAVLG